MSDITIYHNPRCGTSRNTLAMIRNSGVEPLVIEYLKTPPTREQLSEPAFSSSWTRCGKRPLSAAGFGGEDGHAE